MICGSLIFLVISGAALLGIFRMSYINVQSTGIACKLCYAWFGGDMGMVAGNWRGCVGRKKSEGSRV